MSKPLLRISLLATMCIVNLNPRPQAAWAQPDVERGKQVFQKSTCEVCHPGGGNNVNPHAPLKGPHFAKEFSSDESIVKVIRSGIKGTPMPAFGKDKISDTDMKDLVAYIRSLTPKNGK